MSENERYAVMYSIVCGAASEAIELLDGGNSAAARRVLQDALYKAEELYIGDTELEEPAQ